MLLVYSFNIVCIVSYSLNHFVISQIFLSYNLLVYSKLVQAWVFQDCTANFTLFYSNPNSANLNNSRPTPNRQILTQFRELPHPVEPDPSPPRPDPRHTLTQIIRTQIIPTQVGSIQTHPVTQFHMTSIFSLVN